MSNLRKTLFRRGFFTLWSSQIISEFGDRLNQMALVALVYSKAPGSVSAMAKLVFFTVIPVFIVGPVAGALADRWSRKKIMIIADVSRGVMAAMIPFFVSRGFMPAVYVLIFLIFSGTRFFLPSKMAIIPCVVPEEDLLEANALTSTTRVIASALGFVVSGFLVKWLGYSWGFYIDGLTYFISAALVFTIAMRALPGQKPRTFSSPATSELIKAVVRKNLFKEMIEGLSFMTKPGKMREMSIALFFVMSGAGFIFCVLIVFVQEIMKGSTRELGVMGAFCGVGLLFGALVYGKFWGRFNKVKSMLVASALTGISLSFFAANEMFTGEHALRWLALFLTGFFAGPIASCANYIAHISVPDEARGRVFSSMESIMHLGFILFMGISALAARVFSTFDILFWGGILFSASALIGIFMVRRRQERQID